MKIYAGKKGDIENSGPLTLPLSADRKSATDEAVADFLSADICYSKCIAPNNYGEMFDCVCYGRGRRTRTLDLRFWRGCHIKRTVTKFRSVEPFVLLALLNLMPFDALLMLSENLCKFDAQLPKNRHT